MRNCLVLSQHRDEASEYNDFIGKFYHFPANRSKSYLSQFDRLPIEFIYYEPKSEGGRGEFFGFGRITKPPFKDKRESDHYFVEIDDYKPFGQRVPYKDDEGNVREASSESYNPQNAVRRIPETLLDEICLDGEIQLNFNSDAHLIKVLGEQLIASEKVGVLELIKNAYDAHASYCHVTIENSPELRELPDEYYRFSRFPGPVIVIEDDGLGMDRQTIENGWLRPASIIKTHVKDGLKAERQNALERGNLEIFNAFVSELKKANKGRIPLGEKGVGRFASHRLGRSLELTTKKAEFDYEFVLKIDWDRFDKYEAVGVDLRDIGIGLSRQKPSRDYGPTNSGTRLVISGGRESFGWSETKIIDLSRSITQLNSPHPNPANEDSTFVATLDVPQLPDLEDQNTLEFDPTFQLVGLVDERGNLDYTLTFEPPKSVPMARSVEADVTDLTMLSEVGHWKQRKGKLTECGPFFLNIKLWYRRAPWISGPNASSFMERLDRYGGISIYRDGLNVFPAEWGAQTDWLGLSKAHIKQGKRLSYYNMVGNVEIDQGANIGLTDKTNREGMVENDANADFIILLRTIIKTIVENAWIAKRDEYTSLTKEVIRDPKALQKFGKQSLAIHKSIDTGYPIEQDPFNILTALGDDPTVRAERHSDLTRSLEDLQASLDLISDQQDLLTEQAGYGLAIASSIHEINKITTNFFYGINEVLKSSRPSKERLERLKDNSSSLRGELKRLSPLMALRGESRKDFKISRAIRLAIENYRTRMKDNDVTLILDATDDFEVFARFGAIAQVFSNLLDNSLYWLDNSENEKREIRIKIDSDHRSVLFSDNGPDIHSAIIPHLFMPGYSMKVPRSGLGLYICKYYMQDMKGDIQNLQSPKYRDPEMKGAQFFLDFNMVRRGNNHV